MKGEKILDILENIAGAGGEGMAFMEAFLKSGYGASRWKIEKEMRKITDRKEEAKYQRSRYSSIISKLKRDGLLEEKEKGRVLKITLAGLDKLKQLIKRNKKRLPDKNYEIKKGDELIIISFDISEKEREKREWLREILKILDFNMIQKSVWIGKNRIPERLIADLIKMNIEEQVKIFKVSKEGNLRSAE